MIKAYGFRSKENSTITLKKIIVKLNYFENGIISIDSLDEGRYYTIEDSEFLYNTGYDGTIININEIDSNSKVIFKNSTFIGNFCMDFGGIIYSKSKNSNLNVYFYECKFNDNEAYQGIINK